jgi:putative holliday junction resolvase
MQRILCLDYGDRKVGVSASDLLGITAQGVGVIFHKEGKELFKELAQLIDSLNVSKIVVGLPKNMDGSIGFRGEKTLAFIKKLEDHFKGLPILTWDERLSTVSAKRVMIETGVKSKSKKNVEDKIAASFILQSFLDSIH